MATHGRRRALGQHFLRDTGIAGQIANTALEEADAHQCVGLLEIGPGKGAITQPILDGIGRYSRIEKFILVERDEKFGREWQTQLQSKAGVSVKIGDFLDLAPAAWLEPTPMAVVSNLPYSAGTAILTRLAAEHRSIPVMVLMFQAEVAKRLLAEPSSSGRGSLSVWIQNYWDVRSLVVVPPRAFIPPPEVTSEVVVLTRRATPHIDLDSANSVGKTGAEVWQELLHGAFAHRRKMLRSSFPWPEALKASGVDPTLRAEALDWAEWEKLFRAVAGR